MFPNLDLKLSSGSLYIQNELVGTGYLDPIHIDESDPPTYIRSINRSLSAKAEFSFECEIDAPVYNRLIGFDASPFPDATGFSMIFSSPYQVQRRRHKKKRINKKWAKRYGYVTKYKKVKLDEVYFKGPEKDEYDFYTKNIEVVI